MNLDRSNLAKLKKREFVRDPSLYIPEGYSSDHKSDLEKFAKS